MYPCNGEVGHWPPPGLRGLSVQASGISLPFFLSGLPTNLSWTDSPQTQHRRLPASGVFWSTEMAKKPRKPKPRPGC